MTRTARSAAVAVLAALAAIAAIACTGSDPAPPDDAAPSSAAAASAAQEQQSEDQAQPIAAQPEQQAAPIGGYRAVSASYSHSCAIRSDDGAIRCWGSNINPITERHHGQSNPPRRQL